MRVCIDMDRLLMKGPIEVLFVMRLNVWTTGQRTASQCLDAESGARCQDRQGDSA